VTGRVAFRFTARDSPAASWDIRFRVVSMMAFCVAALSAEPLSLAPLLAGLIFLLVLAKTTAKEILSLLKFYAAFFVLLVGLGTVFQPGVANFLFLCCQGLRIFILILSGHFLTSTATPLDVTAGIQWLLGFLGKRRAYYAASMTSWALASVPRILDQAQTIREAALLRGVDPRRRPVVFLRLLSLSLLVRAVESSAEMSWALEARLFGQTIPDHGLRSRASDFLAAGAWLGWCALSFAVGRLALGRPAS